MKVNCDIVQDLIPLYEDGVCSPGSRAAVEEHLEICEACRKFRETAQNMPQEEPVEASPPAVKRVKRLMTKLRLRSLLSAIALILIAVLCYNQFYIHSGLCFTNWDDIYYAKKFLGYLETGEYELAADMVDFSDSYERSLFYLSWEPEVYTFDTVDIGGETWYFRDGMAGNFDSDRVYTEMDIWEELIFEWGGIIPMDAWNEYVENHALCATTYGSSVQITRRINANGMYLDTKSTLYRKLETPWGDFMMEEDRWIGFERTEKTLADYGIYFTYMPEDMYLDVKDALDAYPAQEYARLQAKYGYVADMTLEEYSAYKRQQYIVGLEAFFAQGYTLTTGHVSETVYISNVQQWTNTIQAELTRDGETISFTFRVDMAGDRVMYVGNNAHEPNDPDSILNIFNII